MKTIHNIEQGSAEWHALRLGKVTASRFKDVIAKAKGKGSEIGSGKSAETYMMELASERMTGESAPFFESDAMRHGTKMEPKARERYQEVTGNEVLEVAFIEHNDDIGVSPDGLIGLDGMVEIKCPNTKTQIERFLKCIGLPNSYKAQVQGQIWVADREWCDYWSYDDRIEGDASSILEKNYRDDDYIKMIETHVYIFVDKLKEMVDKLRG